MIADNLDKICCEDISLIENYESAISDKTEMWDCHHRLETHDENGEGNGMYGEGLHWYNNGTVEISSKTCPKGFVPGRLKKN